MSGPTLYADDAICPDCNQVSMAPDKRDSSFVQCPACRTRHMRHSFYVGKEVPKEVTAPLDNQQFSTGAVRGPSCAGQKGKFPLRYDLIFQNTEALRAWASAFGEGSLKYPPGNWMKGMPQGSLLKHAIAHIVCEMEGDESEEHLGHAMWNIATWIWMKKHRPEMMDLTDIQKEISAEYLKKASPETQSDLQQVSEKVISITELRNYLDGIKITSGNIGQIRAKLLLPFDCSWNGIVRDETAAR